MSMLEHEPRVWLITGAMTGFGRIMTETVLRHGDIAVATLIAPSALNDLVDANRHHDRLLVLKCDVTSPQDVYIAFEKTIEKYGRCNVVFNNAGIGALAEVECSKQDEFARRMFDVNFWGALNVSREAVRIFRAVNPPGAGGHLLNVSSGAGLVGVPAMGLYAASKHALEGATETLAKELSPNWNIKITLIEPGGHNTGGQMHLREFPIPPAYEHSKMPSQQVRQSLKNPEVIKKMGDPRVAVEKFYDVTRLENPPFRLAVGMDAIGRAREKWRVLSEELDKYESWSVNEKREPEPQS